MEKKHDVAIHVASLIPIIPLLLLCMLGGPWDLRHN